MAQPIQLSTPQIKFPNVTNTQSISPLLAALQQIRIAEEDWLALAERLPKGKTQDDRKAQIQAAISGLYDDVNELNELGYDFARIASTIDNKIIQYDTSWQMHDDHNVEYKRDLQIVLEANRDLGLSIQQMNVDMAPFTKKPQQRRTPNEPRPKEYTHIQQGNPAIPRHQIVTKVYNTISELEQNWLNKSKNIPEDDKFVYFQRVRYHIIDLEKLVDRKLVILPDHVTIEYFVKKMGSIVDKGLERDFQHNTLNGQAQAEIGKKQAEQSNEILQRFQNMFDLGL